jgi:nucleotide-binding universal stress UspA family protein
MNRILVATDGSGSATEAVQFGVELAAEHGAEVTSYTSCRRSISSRPRCSASAVAFPHQPSIEDRTLLDDAAAVAAQHDVQSTTALLKGDTVTRSSLTPTPTTST